MEEKTSRKVSDLAHKEVQLIAYGIAVGRCYWDGYYGSDEDIIKMIGDDIVSYPDEEPLGV